MGALLAIRFQRAIVVVVALLLVIAFLVINHRTSATPVTDHIRIPERLKELENYFKNPSQNGPVKPLSASSIDIDRTLAAASNSTLGFSRILAIHMKHGWDKWDAAVIQSYTSGLDLTYYEAVDGQVDIADAGRVGLPPKNTAWNMGAGQIACWRSHANIWAEIVRTRSPPVMIFEGDAAWDVNLRGIMGTANKNFLEYLAATDPKPIANAPPLVREKMERPADRGVEYNPDDPWQSEHWDVFTLGHCDEGGNFYKDEVHPRREYMDPFNDPSTEHRGWNRVLSRSKGWACTTAYAVSHRGAAKLLIRHAMNLNEPIDLIMKKMINAGELVSYAIHPTPVIQWDYHDGIGMKGGASSDLHRIDNPETDAQSNVTDMSGWDEVWKLKAPWVPAEKMGGKWFKFQRSALWGVWDTIHGKAAQFEMPEVAGVKVEGL